MIETKIHRSLDQERLNVSNKKRTNVFNWRGQFTPEFIEYILCVFAKEGDVILDPFCGSGTVLLESARKGHEVFGCEINPSAYAMSKFISYANLSYNKRRSLLSDVKTTIDSVLHHSSNFCFSYDPIGTRTKCESLRSFIEACLQKIKNKEELVVALNVFFFAENSRKDNLINAVCDSYEIIKKVLMEIPFSENKISVELCDARLVHQNLKKKFDLIITSPPYINVFNYHQNYRSIMEVLGFDILRVARSEIGSNRQNRGNRFRTVVQYALDMEMALHSISHSLKEGGKIVLVVGRESMVRGVPFFNSQILLDISMSLGIYDEELVAERMFVNKFGEQIKEDVIVLQKKDNSVGISNAIEVARKHLETAVILAQNDVLIDIKSVLSDIDNITYSPLFIKKGICNGADSSQR